MTVSVIEPGSDPLSRMFAWWNAAYREKAGFSEQAFSRFFSPNVEMWINGDLRAAGLDGLSQRFHAVQAGSEAVAVELPFIDCFASADGTRIYTRHRVSFRSSGGVDGAELVSGWASIDDDGRISRIDFLSIEQIQ